MPAGSAGWQRDRHDYDLGGVEGQDAYMPLSHLRYQPLG